MLSTENTTEIPAAPAREQPRLAQLLGRPGTRVVLLAGSRDPNAKITVILLDAYGPSFIIKIPTTREAAQVVRAEGMLLRQLADIGLGQLATTLPRQIGYLTSGGLPALASTALIGTPMAVGYHAWRHTARQRRVRADFRAAGDWLADLQQRTAGRPGPVTLLADCLDTIEARFPDHPNVAVLRARLATAADRLAGERTPRTVVHGDYWFGNLLVDRRGVVGVVDWECGHLAGEPLRDVARFAVSYALYLDRHVRPGARVPGHRGLYADRWGAGIAHAVAGQGWFGALVREHVSGALERLGVPGARWRDVLLAGIAEVVATADDPEFASAHLDLLVDIASSDEIAGPDVTAVVSDGPDVTAVVSDGPAGPPQAFDAVDGNEPAVVSDGPDEPAVVSDGPAGPPQASVAVDGNEPAVVSDGPAGPPQASDPVDGNEPAAAPDAAGAVA